MAKLEPRTDHVPKIGHEKNPKGYEISQKTLDQSTQPRNQGSRIMARTDGERIGLDRNDWTGLDQLKKFERIQYVDVTPK